MSLTAVLVLAVVVIILLVGWLAVVFRADRPPAGRQPPLAEKTPGTVRTPEP
jgi:hypothetical protein